MSPPVHKLPLPFEAWLKALLEQRGVQLEQPRALAAQIQKLSDFFITHPGNTTPWNESFSANAYLSYFLPLNLVRLQAAWQEVIRFLPSTTWSEIWDIGVGLGATHWVLENDQSIEARPFYGVETSLAAQKLYQQCVEAATAEGVSASTQSLQWSLQFKKSISPDAGALGVFSYSFLEMQQQLPDLRKFDHLLIVEPSMRECGRQLLEWRARLLEMGFQVLAPCVHQQSCPLLLHSQKDWCHMRIHFEAPEWWRQIEAHLPMQNRTLTYSYLLMSQTVAATAEKYPARVIGDTLHEKGKSRQMICRGPNREFLSWLHKNGEPPEIPHGALITSGMDKVEVKGAELRAPPDSLDWIC